MACRKVKDKSIITILQNWKGLEPLTVILIWLDW